jgi:hypothetical protein
MTPRETNACAALSAEEFASLERAAADYLAAKGKLMSTLEQAGNFIQSGLHRLPGNIQQMVADRARDGLQLAFRTAILGMEAPSATDAAGGYRLGGMVSGALGGFGGLATTLAELPVTTGLIMRSVAAIARADGFDLADEEVRATCVEVFAFGGPLEEDDDADLAFWTARLGGRQVAQMMVSAAARYAPAMAAKVGAQAVPLLGAAVGAGLNLVYMDFYQRMARVVFRLLPIERAHDRAMVRSCFASVVEARRAA